MCGRYTFKTPLDDIAALFGLHGELPPFDPRYNIAPTQTVPIIIAESGQSELRLMRWGLIPHWAKDTSIGNRLINARAETVADKPAFRDAYRHRRCLVPADGFYEWKTRGKRKQPYYIHRRDDEPIAFAGLWESWTDPEQKEPLETFTIITTEPNELLRPIHNRMPVILTADDAESWLTADLDKAAGVLRPVGSSLLQADPVSSRVNTPANDDASLIEVIESPADRLF